MEECVSAFGQHLARGVQHEAVANGRGSSLSAPTFLVALSRSSLVGCLETPREMGDDASCRIQSVWEQREPRQLTQHHEGTTSHFPLAIAIASLELFALCGFMEHQRQRTCRMGEWMEDELLTKRFSLPPSSFVRLHSTFHWEKFAF